MGKLGQKFKVVKMLLKGVEGSVIAGGGAEAVVQALSRTEDVSLSNVEHAAGVLVIAAIGFALKAVKNYLKNKS